MNAIVKLANPRSANQVIVLDHTLCQESFSDRGPETRFIPVFVHFTLHLLLFGIIKYIVTALRVIIKD